jgi:diguanylate cyclase (GGDEF)-like protein
VAAGKVEVVKSGNLEQHPIGQLLQSVRSAGLTGKLEVRAKQGSSLVYFQDGVPVHASTADTEGDNAVIELLTWKEGQFAFESRVLRGSHTVHQSIESLVEQSIQLSERTSYLTSVGIKSDSVLCPAMPGLTDAEFVQRAGNAAPIEMEELKRFYHSITGKETIEEALRAMQWPRVQMINVVYHLLRHGLVKISNGIMLQKASVLKPRPIEASAIQSVMMSLRKLETGMFSYPAFLYFLEQEYFRCHRSSTPLSVIVFHISGLNGGSNGQALSAAQMLDAVLRISLLKRHIDLIAHYGDSDFALLLPNTKANGANTFAKRIFKALAEAPLAGEATADQLSFAFGCASMPEDSTDLPSLLGAADMALDRSRQTKKTVVMYRDIKPLTL